MAGGAGPRQHHGLDYEEQAAQRHGVTLSTSPVARFDGTTADGIPVSFKTKRRGSAIELGSWLRNSETADVLEQEGAPCLRMIVGHWESSPGNVVEETVVDLPPGFFRQHFPKSWRQEVVALFEGVSNDRSYDATWRRRRKEFQGRYRRFAKDNGVLVRMNPKRDHKSQKRMQCSIPYRVVKDLAARYPAPEDA